MERSPRLEWDGNRAEIGMPAVVALFAAGRHPPHLSPGWRKELATTALMEQFARQA